MTAVATPRPAARLLHHRATDDGAIVAFVMDGAVLCVVRVESADQAELCRLNDHDRARLQSAVLALGRDATGGDDAA